MAGKSSVDGRYWFPLGARDVWREAPAVGAVLAWEHEAWRVIEVYDYDVSGLEPDERAYATRGGRTPQAMRIRPVRDEHHPDPVTARKRDRHVAFWRGEPWKVYPDPEHYPVCACCAEPMPCRAEIGRRYAQESVKTMTRYETAGVCPACAEPVTQRQRSLTFSDNLEVIAGPPVTFHFRGRCRWQAAEYEKRWVAADPERRRHTLTCPGLLTNHNDGTYGCTQLRECPGPTARHTTYRMCRCPDCHARPWTWGRGCHPDPKARLVDTT